MSFEEIWQENKTLILQVLGGVVIFVVGNWVIASMFEDDIRMATRGTQASLKRAKQQKVASGATNQVTERRDELRDELDTLEREMSYSPSKGFTLASIEGASDVHFNQVVDRMLSSVIEVGLSRGVRIQSDLGLGAVTPKTDAEREWYLNGLDLVERVAVAGIAAGVQSIEPIRIARRSKKRSRTRTTTNSYMQQVDVSFSAIGPPMAIDSLLRDLMPSGSRLAVAKASITSMDDPNPKRGAQVVNLRLVRLDMTLRALLIDEDGVPQQDKEKRL